MRLLTFPMPTMTLINGSVYGVGIPFALLHDFRMMRSDAKFLQSTEITVDFPIHHGMGELLTSTLPP